MSSDPRHCAGAAGRVGPVVMVTYNYRITFTLQVTEKEITLLDVGSHDEVYG